MTKPAVQKPHWKPAASANARCTGCRSSGVPSPASVVTSCVDGADGRVEAGVHRARRRRARCRRRSRRRRSPSSRRGARRRAGRCAGTGPAPGRSSTGSPLTLIAAQLRAHLAGEQRRSRARASRRAPCGSSYQQSTAASPASRSSSVEHDRAGGRGGDGDRARRSRRRRRTARPSGVSASGGRRSARPARRAVRRPRGSPRRARASSCRRRVTKLDDRLAALAAVGRPDHDRRHRGRRSARSSRRPAARGRGCRRRWRRAAPCTTSGASRRTAGPARRAGTPRARRAPARPCRSRRSAARRGQRSQSASPAWSGRPAR